MKRILATLPYKLKKINNLFVKKSFSCILTVKKWEAKEMKERKMHL